MTKAKNDTKTIEKGDLVMVQPMRYCLSFTDGGIENLLRQDEPPIKLTHHWSEDGFKARVLQRVELERKWENQKTVDTYFLVKLFGQGRKHFTRRDDTKTKEVWVEERLVSRCIEKDKTKKKENNK